MSGKLTGKTAAVTGAASGIGLECARILIEEGAQVVLVDRAGDRLQSLCADLGPAAHPLVVDLLDGAQVSAMGAGIEALVGPLAPHQEHPRADAQLALLSHSVSHFCLSALGADLSILESQS